MFVVSFGAKRHILKAVLEVIRMKRLSLADLAETIKSNRIEKGITQEQLCKKTGINRNMIGRIERMDYLSLIHISEPTRRSYISYAVFCLKKNFF